MEDDADMIIKISNVNIGDLLGDFDFIPKDWKESHFADMLSHVAMRKIPSEIVTYHFLLPNLETLEKLNGEDWN